MLDEFQILTTKLDSEYITNRDRQKDSKYTWDHNNVRWVSDPNNQTR